MYNSTNGFDIYNYGAIPVRFFTNSLERMRIDPMGNVEIGTTSNSTGLTPINAKMVIRNSTGSNALSLES